MKLSTWWLPQTRVRIGPKMWNPQLLLTGQALMSPPNPWARHWATPNCHSSHSTLALYDDYHKQAVTHIWESRWFESMYTLQGKTRPTRHVRFPRQSTYAQHTLPAGSPIRGNLSWVIDRVEQAHCSREEGLPTQSTACSWLIRGSVPIFSTEPANEAVGAKPSIYQRLATRLTGPITPVCDRYVQYMLAGANRTVFNRHRRGLQPWRYRLATYHSPTF
jgi:hypothetical protein